MLPPDARAVLTDLLRPPTGYELDHALGLTYSLDLESALAIPLAFASLTIRNSTDPIAVMEAVRRCSSQVDVFCQAGQVRVPRSGHDLMAFLEPSIHLVDAPRPGHLFHPKLWALRFRDDENNARCVRLVVLSRNLTTDQTSWDTSLRLDGTIGDVKARSNRQLRLLIEHTLRLSVHPLESGRRQAVDDLIGDIERATWELPDGVEDIVFHALGVPGESRPDFDGDRHLAAAPFCNEKGLDITMPTSSSRPTLISSQNELDLLPEHSLANTTTYVINALAGLPAVDDDDGPAVSDEVHAGLPTADDDDAPAGGIEIHTGLHAKFYIVQRGYSARVFIGSANATDAAFGGNVEILAELRGKRSKLGIDKLLDTADGFGGILEPYSRGEPVEDDADDRALANLMRSIAAVPLTMRVEPGGNEDVSLHLTSDNPLPRTETDVRITAELITRKGEAKTLDSSATVDARFAGVDVGDITPFVTVIVHDHRGESASTVVCARLVGDPPGRLNEVIARQLDDHTKFLRFLALLLGQEGMSWTAFGDGQGVGAGAWVTGDGSGILELLLRGLADRPSQLTDLARVVESLTSTERGRSVLPDGFGELWAVVDEVRRELVATEAGR